MTHIHIMLISHGNLASELNATASDIMGVQDDISCYSVQRGLPVETIKAEIKQQISQILNENQLLIMTDMLGGTPSNIILPFLKDEKVEVLTGMNLAMLIAAMNKRKNIDNVRDLVLVVENSAIESIVNMKNKINIK